MTKPFTRVSSVEERYIGELWSGKGWLRGWLPGLDSN